MQHFSHQLVQLQFWYAAEFRRHRRRNSVIQQTSSAIADRNPSPADEVRYIHSWDRSRQTLGAVSLEADARTRAANFGGDWL